MHAGQKAYRRKKNRQLWAAVGGYARALQRQDILPVVGQRILNELFQGRPVVELTAAEEPQFWRACAEALVRVYVRQRFHTEHISALSGGQLRQLAEDVERLSGGQTPRRATGFAEYRDITAQQRTVIAQMYAALGWNETQQQGLNARILKKAQPETRQDANSLIRAIQAVFLHQLDLASFAVTVAAGRAQWERLDDYKRRLIADAERKLASGHGKAELTMGLVCKVQEVVTRLKGSG